MSASGRLALQACLELVPQANLMSSHGPALQLLESARPSSLLTVSPVTKQLLVRNANSVAALTARLGVDSSLLPLRGHGGG